jgi:ferredoxin
MSSKNLSERKQKKMRIKRTKKLDAICEYVNAQKEGKFETRGLLRKILLAPLRSLEKPIFMYQYQKLSQTSNKSFSELVPLADRSFRTNENCNGCGVCVEVCPVNNIELVNKRPVWQNYCETCYGCYAWCPQSAIQGDIVSYNEKYHHPEVKLSDMIVMT